MKSTKALLFGHLLIAINSFAQAGSGYEERPSFGVYAEIAHFSDMTFSYKEKPNADTSTVVANYHLVNGEDFKWAPIVGISGQLPFIFKNWMNLQAKVGGAYFKYQVHSDDAQAVSAQAQDKDLKSFVFVIQGGPEFGVPLIANEATETLLKPYIFGNILVGVPFNWSTHFTNNPYFGLTSGGGFRYVHKRLSLEGGVKGGLWMWKPLYDPAFGKQTADEGLEKENKFRAVFYQNLSPYFDVKITTF